MSKKKVCIVIGVILSILIIILLIILSIHKNAKNTYEDYLSESTEIHMDFSNDSEYDVSWHRNNFDSSIAANFYEISYDEITEDVLKDEMRNAPSWIRDEYPFYPQDALGYLTSLKLASKVLDVESSDMSESTSYYTYSNATVFVMKINEVDVVFVYPDDVKKVYMYRLSDELK